MERTEAEGQLQAIAETIVREFQPEKIILFGSWAWGAPGPDSDVDFFIVKESRERRVERERTLRKRLYGRRFPPMDLLIYTPSEVERRLFLEDPFVTQILAKGRVLYGRS